MVVESGAGFWGSPALVEEVAALRVGATVTVLEKDWLMRREGIHGSVFVTEKCTMECKMSVFTGVLMRTKIFVMLEWRGLPFLESVGRSSIVGAAS
jgi:hypothetical protein